MKFPRNTIKEHKTFLGRHKGLWSLSIPRKTIKDHKTFLDRKKKDYEVFLEIQ